MTSKPVVLVGPMGVGKTTVGKKLAKRLELPFIDTDAVITKNHGDISSIFANIGEQAFREIDSETRVPLVPDPAVISTGGGAVLHEISRDALTLATVVYLSTDGKHIASRLRGGNRPLIKNGISDWRHIYNSRKPLYEQVADITVDTSNSSLVQTIDAILEGLKRQNAGA
ncbi:MAG: shikimate kinase [Rhodoluna sp.]